MKQIRELAGSVYKDSLYRNSLYLMASTAVMSGFGFIFWMLNARLYSAHDVGLATTLISAASLISGFSILGLGNGLIRFLPTSERANNKINTVFTVVGITALVMTIGYIVGIQTFSPDLQFVRDNLFFGLLFIGYVLASSYAGLIDSIFVAYRSSVYVLLKNSIFSATKIIFPILLVSLGAIGIFASLEIAVVLSVLISLIFLVRKFKYEIKPMVDTFVVKRMFRFSFGNFIAGFIGGLPTMILPILITNAMGAEYSAYFYIDMMIANFIFIIPLAVSQSLFAEGSNDETDIKIKVYRSSKLIFGILIPVIVLVHLFGKYILKTFGESYFLESFILLRLLNLSSLFLGINCIVFAVLRIKHKIKTLVWLNVTSSFLVLLLMHLFLNMGLTGVGLSLLSAQIITCVIALVALEYEKRH